MEAPESPLPLATDCTVFFCRLTRMTLEQGLVTLLHKTLRKGWRASVCLPEKERWPGLSEALWTVDGESILPHGFLDDPYPESQPIWIADDGARPNHAEVLFLCQGIWREMWPPDDGLFTDLRRLCLMIEPLDSDATDSARTVWRQTPEEQRQVVKL